MDSTDTLEQLRYVSWLLLRPTEDTGTVTMCLLYSSDTLEQ